MYFWVCHRILVLSLCVQQDRKRGGLLLWEGGCWRAALGELGGCSVCVQARGKVQERQSSRVMVASGEPSGRLGAKGEGMKKYNLLVTE